MARKHTPTQLNLARMVENGFAIHTTAGLVESLGPVLAAQSGRDGDDMICHRTTANGVQMFRIQRDGTVTQH